MIGRLDQAIADLNEARYRCELALTALHAPGDESARIIAAAALLKQGRGAVYAVSDPEPSPTRSRFPGEAWDDYQLSES